MRRAWKRIRHRLEWLGCHFLKWSLPHVPHELVRVLADFLGYAVFAFDVKGRQVALANLEVVFGNAMPEPERERVAMASYRNFALTMLELFWGQGLSKTRFEEMTIVSGFREVLEEAAAQDRGIAFLLPHFANWEWAALTFAQIEGCASIVAQDFKNPLLTPLFAEMRRHGRHRLLSQDRAMLKLLRCVRRKEVVAVLPDLNLSPEEGGIVVQVFEPNPVEICVTPIQAVLGLRGHALLVPVEVDRLEDGRLSVCAMPPLDFSEMSSTEEIVRGTWGVYEARIRRKPELWLWAYKHFRFRPENPTRAYPFYARPHPGFELLREGAPRELEGDTSRSTGSGGTRDIF